MGLTGVIYAIIVACWAAYLVPMALRRHDEAARSRSIERFSSAMRVLARRGTAHHGRTVVTPRRDSALLIAPSRGLAGPSDRPAEAVRAPAPRPNRAAMRAAAARRRRVLSLLGLMTLVTTGVAAFGVVPWWAVAVPVGLVVAFLVIARRQVRKASEDYWVEAGAGEVPSHVIRRDAARVEASHGVARDDAGPGDDHHSGDGEPTVTLTAEEVAAVRAGLTEERVLAVSVQTADGDSLWDPLPVTLPTYVDKPVAKRSVRTIDLGGEGVFSAGHDEADSQTASEAADAAAEEARGSAVDEAAEAPKVVNG